jgi:YjbE family integral membrane protein
MFEAISAAETWAALGEIVFINILLSGDNAVVIALACRSLPPRQRKLGILFGTLGAIVLRIVLTLAVLYVLKSEIPYVQLIGAVLLLWIGIKLLAPDNGGGSVFDSDNLIAAIKTIVIADCIMSLDNVLGVAAAAHGSVALIVIGLALSIPIIILGSALIMKLMDRFPFIITVGAALLGYVAGEMALSDPAVVDYIQANARYLHYALPLAGALFVVVVGKWQTRKREAEAPAPLIDLAARRAVVERGQKPGGRQA